VKSPSAKVDRMSKLKRRLVAVGVGFIASLLLGQAAQAKTVPVRWGDTLSGIVQRECGSSDWSRAARDNARTNPNPNLIYAGQTLEINCGAAAPVQPQAQQPRSTGAWAAPLCGRIGDRLGAGRNHKGVDLGAPYGRAVRAASAGTAQRGWDWDGAGNYITINHGGLWTHYFHLSSFAVGSGQRVAAGQIIGYVGATGNAQGPHLHFEVRTGREWGSLGDVPTTILDPVSFMASRGVSLRC